MKPWLKYTLIYLSILLVMVGLFYFLAKTPARKLGWIRHDVGEEIFGSPENLQIFLNADTLVARRLKGTAPNANHLTGYELGPEIQIPIEDMDRLRGLLKNEVLYQWNTFRFCAPTYGVLISARDNTGKTISIAICFECQMIGIFENDQLVGSKDFDLFRKRLTALIKPLFPDDPEIQAIPD